MPGFGMHSRPKLAAKNNNNSNRKSHKGLMLFNMFLRESLDNCGSECNMLQKFFHKTCNYRIE